MICSIEGVGVWGAGYSHWKDVVARNPVGFDPDEPVKSNETDDNAAPALSDAGPKPEIIPARERRRAPLAVKLAVEVAAQAFEQTSMLAEDTTCVFASGMGDTNITDHMCRAVATADKLLSPTKFHNSVHNAAAGYWSISTDCMMPANSISAFNYTAALALLEASTQCSVQQRPVLLVVFDTKTPATFAGSMTINENFACALLLTPQRDATKPNIKIESGRTAQSMSQRCVESNFTMASTANPAAQLLPLLHSVATGTSKPLILPMGFGTSLTVQLDTAAQAHE